MDESKKDRDIRRVRKLSTLMDSQFEIPGIGIRFGLDPIIGLIPGLGDFLTSAIGAYPIRLAIFHDLPRPIILQMVYNLGLDYLLGNIPLLGDIFDVAFKANQRNFKLLVTGMEQPRAQKAHSLIFIGLISLLVLAILTAPVTFIVLIIQSIA